MVSSPGWRRAGRESLGGALLPESMLRAGISRDQLCCCTDQPRLSQKSTGFNKKIVVFWVFCGGLGFFKQQLIIFVVVGWFFLLLTWGPRGGDSGGGFAVTGCIRLVQRRHLPGALAGCCAGCCRQRFWVPQGRGSGDFLILFFLCWCGATRSSSLRKGGSSPGDRGQLLVQSKWDTSAVPGWDGEGCRLGDGSAGKVPESCFRKVAHC